MQPIIRWLLLTCVILLTLSAALAYEPPQSPRTKYDFNAGWRVNVGDVTGAEATSFNDAAWKQVSTPYAWNEDDAFKKSIDELSTGIAWYRKHFVLPANSAGRKVFLEFEGIRHGGEFYLNGELIGRHENGVMAFGFDITDKVKPAPQENVLAAKINNAWDYREQATNQRYQWNDKNFYANYGGINKNVYLHVTDRLHQTLPLYSNLGTTGVYIYVQDFNIAAKSATVTAESQVKNEDSQARTFTYQAVIEDMDGKIVKTIEGGQSTLAAGETKTVSAGAKVDNLNFWSWGYGYLYNVYTILRVNNQPVDVVKTRTGFRKAEYSGGMVRLNDHSIQMKGYAQRTTNEWPALGINVPPWVSDFSNSLMVESNANLVRWMHVTPSKQDVESCDRVGLIQAMPAGDSERDVTGRRWEQRVEVMRDATIYNRNNPSILFYESGNAQISEEHMAEMKAIRDQYDPHGGRAAGSRDMLGSKVAEYGGEMLYINKSAHIPFWAMEYSRDEGLRKYWDEWSPPFHKEGDGPQHQGKPAPSYNHNQDQHAIEDVRRWADYWRERPGTGARVNSGGVNIIFSDSNTHHRGESNYRTSGEVDAMRLPKDGFYAHQVMWDGWVNVERPRARILGHWNYTPEVKKPVYVVASAEKVELFLNGKPLGFGQQSYHFLFTFPDVQWQQGVLRAVGYDAAGKQLCEDIKKTAGEPVAIRLTSHTGPQGFKADGADLALVDVEIVDAQGNRCPTALNLINFALTGPAEWRGGIAQGLDNSILSKSLPVEGGINRISIRSTMQAGKSTLTATAEGLKPATIELTSKPIQVNDGLSGVLPDADLPSYLGRGPTPRGESFEMLRKPLQIMSAKAGASSDKAAQSYDDNEDTGWSNGDDRKSGWIQYELAQPAKVSELTLKMAGWREKSYPIRITVDGKEVWIGSTPPSLGYITIPMKPTTGKNVGIELTGAAVNRDAFGNITELENPANAATGGSTAKGNLNIIEVEIYESLGKETELRGSPPASAGAGATTASGGATGMAAERLSETKPTVAKPTGEKRVAFRISAEKPNRYVTAVQNGGLTTKGATIAVNQTFLLIDLNGGELADGDSIHIQWAPIGSKPTYWGEGEGTVGRYGGKPKDASTFKITLKEKADKDAPKSIVLQTASGKFVSVPSKGAALATTDTEDKATTLEVVDVPTPKTTE
jgi:beta-galactosidase